MTLKMGDHDFTLRMRQVIRQFAREEIARLVPGDRYAVVTALNYTARKATVQYHNGTNFIVLPFSADCQPTHVGQLVRVSGGVANRYVSALIDKPIWSDATLQHSWANVGFVYPNAGYIRDQGGRVHMRGVVTGGTLNTSILTLPVGFRPVFGRVYAASNGGAGAGAVSVLNDGTVVPSSSFPGGNAFLSLDGIGFPAA